MNSYVRWILKIGFLATILSVVSVYAAEHQMSHEEHQHNQSHMETSTPLTSAGNYAFWTIQEVIEKLDSDPQTDWSKVNLEALRQHLIDMQNFTLNVNVLSQHPIAMGMKAVIRPTTKDAAASLDRVFSAHPAQLHKETGWKMKVVKKDGNYQLTVTTKKAAEVDRINGLGYIGVMALGTHHQVHHWAMAKGLNPHQ